MVTLHTKKMDCRFIPTPVGKTHRTPALPAKTRNLPYYLPGKVASSGGMWVCTLEGHLPAVYSWQMTLNHFT